MYCCPGAIAILRGSALLTLSTPGYMSARGFLLNVAGMSISGSLIVLCASAICMSRFPTRLGRRHLCCSQMGLAFGVSSVLSSVSSDAITLLGVGYIVLPALGLILCAEDGSAADCGGCRVTSWTNIIVTYRARFFTAPCTPTRPGRSERRARPRLRQSDGTP